MKSVLSLFFVTLLASETFAATIRAARIDDSGRNILIDVTYGGGCGKHDFSLKLHACLESYPVQCSADLIEKTNDVCEALVSSQVSINLHQYGLDDRYFSRGTLKITGDQDLKLKKRQ